jgi:hypothetical protein
LNNEKNAKKKEESLIKKEEEIMSFKPKINKKSETLVEHSSKNREERKKDLYKKWNERKEKEKLEIEYEKQKEELTFKPKLIS